MRIHALAALAGLSLTLGGLAQAASIQLKDPRGDDKGPGTYIYPTDAAYNKGCFDMTGVELKKKGNKLEISVDFAKPIKDPWDSLKWQPKGNGFSVQMVQIYLDTDHKAGSGFTKALPGMNAAFAPDQAWDKVIIISPQPASKVKQEVEAKAGPLKAGVVVPKTVTVRGKTLVATINCKDLGAKFSKGWGVQAIVGSNEGYPAATDILSRKVNEFEGPHRFGGGCDYDGDPHFIDCLAGAAKGDASEAEAQYKALKAYKCSDKAAANVLAVLPMVYGK